MDNRLHDSVMGEGPDVVLLHGLFGQGSNLGSIARSLQTEFRVHSPDLPDHGRSDWTARPSVERYADAISQWMFERCIARAHFVGHSLGGKVAMQLALAKPELVDKLVIADIAPIAYPPGHDDVFSGMAAVAAERCSSRQEATTVLSAHVSDAAVVQFLSLSLKRDTEGRYVWRLNRAGLEAGYDQLRGALDADKPFYGKTLFIRGSKSNYVTDDAVSDIERLFSHVAVERLSGAGHWLHVEQPDAFNALVLAFLV